jgi:hypothetical protein
MTKREIARWVGGIVVGGLALATLPGLTCGPSTPSPCEVDRFGCGDTSPDPGDFYLASCPADLGPPLEVEVGTGEETFVSFGDLQGPEVHYGPQGGQHVFIGLRVKNARLDVSPLLKFNFYIGQGEGCDPPASGDELPTCTTTLGLRELILGGTGFEMTPDANGAIEVAGLVVFVSVPMADGGPKLVGMRVEDPCHRHSADFQVWTR